ncbi:MAG: phosphatase PAP2 family protein [Burkholderiales bacterium]
MQSFFSVLGAIASVAVLLCGAAAVCAAGDCGSIAWDLRVLEWFSSIGTPVFDSLFSAMTWLGSLWLLFPAALILVIVLAMRGRAMDALRFSVAFGGSCALAYGAKYLVGRPRPSDGDALVTMPSDPSFPSGHAMQITAFALAAVWLLAPQPQRRHWFAAALMLIALVGASRLYLQVHFPSDVVAGTIAAALWVLAVVFWKRPRHA